MRIKLRVAAIAAALLCALAAAVAVAGPAEAATPQCVQVVAAPANGGGPVWGPAAADGSRLCWMQRGNYSPAVGALQRALISCYGRAIADDNDFGPKTEAALKLVQGWIGAVPDGKYGPETARKLRFPVLNGDPGVCGNQSL